jgi:NitT/TauT family transport system ATP-binding protein
MTVLFVTHDVEEALLLGDRVCVMSSGPGRIVESIDVTIARPRGVEAVETMEFVKLRKLVREHLATAMAAKRAERLGVGAS